LNRAHWRRKSTP